jgi:hypothetical protein
MPEPDDSPELKRIVPEAALQAAEETTPAVGDLAVKETLQISSGMSTDEMEKEAKEREHKRDQWFRDNFEMLAVAAMYVAFVALCIIGVIWLLHMILPERCGPASCWYICFCRWLTPDQVTILQDVLTGGLIGGLLADHFRKRMGR